MQLLPSWSQQDIGREVVLLAAVEERQDVTFISGLDVDLGLQKVASITLQKPSYAVVQHPITHTSVSPELAGIYMDLPSLQFHSYWPEVRRIFHPPCSIKQ